MHRPTVGAIALLLFVLGGVFWSASSADESPAAFACFRIGAVMAALWLALPQLSMLPRWILLSLFGTLLVVAWRPKTLLFAVPIVLLLTLLGKRLNVAGSRRP